ncbi:tocopherol cyclase, chloroplastic [Humulus lupulus]|uniref:tocopherol cyclase, chloroplastic n=1 Tax=Humulus lupulus TaxID=3486 RepID=UPI002B4111B3|nr:tocopherol cyclase, chloroplastic [Humulus lupulus]
MEGIVFAPCKRPPHLPSLSRNPNSSFLFHYPSNPSFLTPPWHRPKNPNSSFLFHYPSNPSFLTPPWHRPKPGLIRSSVSEFDQKPVSSIDKDKEGLSSSVSPVYTPTPSNRELRTPHSGYHFDGSVRKFFEGWYFKVSIPEKRQSFCFMYSVENPAFRRKLSPLEVAQYGPRFTGVGAQILGADDKYICQFSEESQHFWGSRHELMLGSTFTAGKGQPLPNKEVPPQEFNRRVLEGFQVTPLWHQGSICDDGRSNYVDTVKTARWEYSTRPIFGWGDVASKQKSTAGWLAAFPVFEPHWQICMAGGLSTGWIEWDGERFEFENAPSYSEKNWGGAFPRKWFWVQSNVFKGVTGEVALTAAGGLRQLPGLTEVFENAALVGVHYDGRFYEFVPWNGEVSWEISPWGYWFIAAENETHMVELEATTEHSGTALRAPTLEAGLAPACKDTCVSELRLQLWERKYDGSKGKAILDVTSDMAAVEVGGGPWFNTWKGKTSSPELVSKALNFPVDVEGFLNLVPPLKPPGL